MWVARDKNGWLKLFEEYPHRLNVYDAWIVNKHRVKWFQINDESLFSELKWEDEPLEVAIVPTSFIKEVNNLTDAICGSELGRPENKEKGDILVAMKKVNEQIKDICG